MPVIYTDLRDKVIFIAGIGQVPQPHDDTIWGNGAATAKVLAQSSARVFGCDLDLSAAELTKKRVEEDIPGAVVDVVQADVTKHEDVKRVVAACLEKHGRIDVLVCNVGKSAPGGPVEMSEEVRTLQQSPQSLFRSHTTNTILLRPGTNSSTSTSHQHSYAAKKSFP